MARRVLRSGICLGVVTCVGFAATGAQAEALPEALAKAISPTRSSMPNGRGSAPRRERTPSAGGLPAADRRQSQRRTAGGAQPAARQYRAIRDPEALDHRGDGDADTVQRFQDANSVRVAELQVQSGREALRNVGQGVLLDAVTAYSNVLANQSLVEAQRSNVAFLRETLGVTQKRLNAGDVTRPTPRRPRRA